MKTNIKKSMARRLSLAVGIIALSGQAAFSQVYLGGSVSGGYLHGKRTDSLALAGDAGFPSFEYSNKKLKKVTPELNIFMGYLCNLANTNNYVSIEPFFNITRSKNKASGEVLAGTPLRFKQHALLKREHGLGIVGKFGQKYNKVDSVYLVLGVQANKFKYSTADEDLSGAPTEVTRISTSKILPGALIGIGFDKKLDNNTKIGFDVRYNFYKKLTLKKSRDNVTVHMVAHPKTATAALHYTLMF